MEKEKTHAVIDTSIGCSPDEYYRFYGTLEECQAYIKEHRDRIIEELKQFGKEI